MHEKKPEVFIYGNGHKNKESLVTQQNVLTRKLYNAIYISLTSRVVLHVKFSPGQFLYSISVILRLTLPTSGA